MIWFGVVLVIENSVDFLEKSLGILRDSLTIISVTIYSSLSFIDIERYLEKCL